MYFDETNNYYDVVSNENELEINKYIDKSSYNDVNINIDSINFNRESSLFPIVEGFNKGNMFSNLYSKYKNHVYKLKVNNDKDELLYKIQMYSFALKDYNLYLDIYPNDTAILREFRGTNMKLQEVKKQYESKYGPLCITGVESSSKWTWLNEPWPWDKGGNN